jgi:S-adenosylmethionine:tRNA ribosyltransferase-isomerase
VNNGFFIAHPSVPVYADIWDLRIAKWGKIGYNTTLKLINEGKAMKTHDFWYDLPEELIAQTPLEKRDSSRLLVMERSSGKVEHKHFYDILDYLRPGDCLVMNDSRVLPARLLGHRPTGGAVEVLLLRDLGDKKWECLCKPGRKMQIGQSVIFGNGELTATVTDIRDDGNRVVEFQYEGIFLEVLERLGKMPLPPYIKAELQDQERYQTVYSREVGSAAAPTAGLHWTDDLLHKAREMGVQTAFVTLHVGLGTFRPVKAEEISEHHMHSELCMISQETAEILNQTKANGGRIICVGTTSCRTLESLVKNDGTFEASSKWTEIFIFPGYEFKAMNGLITNFHLPESTLVMLVSAFAGRENVLNAYEEAVKEKYRFFSFGDAMFIG